MLELGSKQESNVECLKENIVRTSSSCYYASVMSPERTAPRPAEVERPKPPVEWFVGLARKGMGLQAVMARSDAFLALHDGAVVHHYGMWHHLGGALVGNIRGYQPLPEKMVAIEEHAAMVQTLTGFSPEELQRRENELKRKYFRKEDNAPFPITWIEARVRPISQPLPEWFIAFQAPDGTTVVRLRRGFMRRSGITDAMASWYAVRSQIKEGIGKVAYAEIERMQQQQERTAKQIEDAIGIAPYRLDVQCLLLQDAIVHNRLIGHYNVRHVASVDDVKAQDYFGMLNSGAR